MFSLILISIISIGISFSQTTINFDTPENWVPAGATSLTAYANHGYQATGILFEGTNILREEQDTPQDGFPCFIGTYAMRLRNQATSNLVITIASGGVSTFSFEVRRWDDTPMPNWTVEYSEDGGTNWNALTPVDGTLLTSSDWFTYNGTVNSTLANVKIRIANTGVTERLMLDNFTWTGMGGSTPALTITTPANGLTVNADEVAVNYSTTNFVLGTDGRLEYKLNGGTAAYTTTSPFTISALTQGANTINFQLVDMSNAALSPAVTVTRTVNYVILSTDPGLTITSPSNGATINSQNVNIAFSLDNFILGTDGKLSYSIDGGADIYYTGTSPIALTGLSYAAHTIDFELVDMSNASLSPAVTASLSFTCAEALPGGMETFDNCEATASYADGSFIGNGNITWNYTQSRDVDTFPINGKGLLLRRASVSKLQSGTIGGGISSFQVSMLKAYTNAQPRQLELYINGELKGTSQEFGVLPEDDATVHIFTVNNINVPGDFTIMIKNVGDSDFNRQTVIDDISWTAFAGTSPYISISSPANNSTITTTGVNVAFNVTNFALGTDGKVKYTLDGGAAQYTTTSPIALTGLSEATHTVTVELVNMANASLSPAVTSSVTFTVNTSGPSFTSIYDIQYTTDPNGNSTLNNQYVWLRGVVSASFNSSPFTKGYYLQQGGGAWKSIYIYDVLNNPEIGDSVSLYGQVVEFNGMTEIKSVTNFTVIGPGGIIAPATILTVAQANVEDYESCLITIDNATCTQASMAYGEWKINDGTADFHCKDAGAFTFSEVLGKSYKITGVIDFYTYFRINYRREADIVVISGVGSEFVNSISLYPNPASNYVTVNVPMGAELITITNTLGQNVAEINANAESVIVNTENFNSGLYFVKITNKTDVAVIRLVIE